MPPHQGRTSVKGHQNIILDEKQVYEKSDDFDGQFICLESVSIWYLYEKQTYSTKIYTEGTGSVC